MCKFFPMKFSYHIKFMKKLTNIYVADGIQHVFITRTGNIPINIFQFQILNRRNDVSPTYLLRFRFLQIPQTKKRVAFLKPFTNPVLIPGCFARYGNRRSTRRRVIFTLPTWVNITRENCVIIYLTNS